MPFLTSPEYVYSYDKSISSPFKRQKNEDDEVRHEKDNIRPPEGFVQVNNIINEPNAKKKFLYTIRHAKAHHNALAKEFTKAISWRFLGKLRANYDPELTSKGIRDAQRAGQTLRELIHQEEAPPMTTIYTSPLKRCIQTALYTIAGLGLDQQFTLHVKEGLREWKGYDHNHQSDRRSTTPVITKLFHDLKNRLNLNVDLKLDGGQDSEDDPIMRETFVDVDRRVRRVLDDIFANDECTSAMLVLHNRSNKSVLRVLGHVHDEVNGLNLENCAVLGYLMGRQMLDEIAVEARDKAEEIQWLKDRDLAETEKQRRHEQAAHDVEEYRWTSKDKLRKLHDFLALWAEQGDGEAARALADLYVLAPELNRAQ